MPGSAGVETGRLTLVVSLLLDRAYGVTVKLQTGIDHKLGPSTRLPLPSYVKTHEAHVPLTRVTPAMRFPHGIKTAGCVPGVKLHQQKNQCVSSSPVQEARTK